jgi:glucose-6-phosphate 1-epimerase
MSHFISFLPSGQQLLHLSNKKCRAVISLFGGQVLSWSPSGHSDVLYISRNAFFDNKSPIRGGVPICWPWFGNKENFSAHGCVRTLVWSLLTIDENNEDSTIIVLSPVSMPPEYREIKLIMTLTFSDYMSVGLKTVNLSQEIFTFTQALHTYLRISNINKIFITGLQGITYHDKLLNQDVTDGNELVTFKQEVDRIYNTSKSLSLTDIDRTIIVENDGGTDTVIWNPWISKNNSMKDLYPEAYKNFVCIEAGNILKPITLHAYQEYEIIQKIRLR